MFIFGTSPIPEEPKDVHKEIPYNQIPGVEDNASLDTVFDSIYYAIVDRDIEAPISSFSAIIETDSDESTFDGYS